MFCVEDSWDDTSEGSQLSEMVFKETNTSVGKCKIETKIADKNTSASNVCKKNAGKLTRKQWKNKQKNRKRKLNKYSHLVVKSEIQNETKEIIDNSQHKSQDSEHDEENIAEENLSDVPSSPKQNIQMKSNALCKLKGARFRYINEQLYTRSSSDAMKLFNQDKEAFVAYHDGYSKQVENWPTNPLKLIISYIKSRPKSWDVADFGCGDAKLAASVQNKVYSFDLVATNSSVTKCDMSHVPLNDESVNIAVFCLSLMGTNLKDFLCEANRVLKMNGVLKIAEVASRFQNVTKFVKYLSKTGFSLIKKDTKNDFFYMFDFKKQKTISKNKVADPSIILLKPCLYKKR